jgi:hypothetical protein
MLCASVQGTKTVDELPDVTVFRRTVEPFLRCNSVIASESRIRASIKDQWITSFI